MKYYDISPTVNPRSAVFPGDLPFTRQILMDFKKGDSLLLSGTASTLHIGAHADAPSHYNRNGESISERNPLRYFGHCQVVEIQAPKGERIYPKHFKAQIKSKRLLIKTLSFPNPDQWTDEFNSLSPELISYFASQGVELIGIDTPSVDPAASKVLETHQEIAKHDLAILEGIILKEVPEGIYTLIALPIKIAEGDAAPVRAILTPEIKEWSEREKS